MRTRMLVSLAISGVVHTGVLSVGDGMYQQSTSVESSPSRTDTLSVSIDAASVVAEAIDTPESDAAKRRASGPGVEWSSNQPQEFRDTKADASRARSRRRVEQADPAVPDELAAAAEETLPDPAIARRAADAQSASKPSTRRRSQRAPGSETAARSRHARAQPTKESRTSEAERSYLSEFLAELSRHKYYPRSARLRGEEGRVVLVLILESNGAISNVKVARPSGHSALNDAALRSVRRMDHFKPFPSEVTRRSWRLNIPFQYAIEPR